MKQILYKNIPIHFTDTGKGTVIVFLHGFLENHKIWDHFIPILSKKNRIITVDLPGHGATGCLGYIHTMEDMATAVHSVLNELHIQKAVFVGHSMGGYVALSFAELYPEYIKGIVLMNSTAKEDSEQRKQNRDRAINTVKQDHTNFISLSLANLFSPDNREKLKAEIEQVKVVALKTSIQGIIAALEGIKIRKDRVALLQLASYPILFILGEKDSILNYNETITQLKDTVAQLVTLPDGHMSSIENRDEVTETLIHFFNNIN